MPAPKGNTNRQVNDLPFDGHLNMRCLRKDKGWWNKAAKAAGFKNLSSWIIHTLNKAAKRILGDPPEE